ncbi:MAG: hypothetical protein LBO09_00575 [Candidatus Peribacteria bacterium]|nr:hypothetical protein [Candidatus Peribacteria bacterium]
METIQMSYQQWENLCKRCGKCCHIKHRVGKVTIIDPELVCPHLRSDNSCDIYEHRLSSECLSVQEVLQKGISGIIPESCAYAHLNPAYRFAIDAPTMEEFWQVVVKNGSVCKMRLDRYLWGLVTKTREIAVEE